MYVYVCICVCVRLFTQHKKTCVQCSMAEQTVKEGAKAKQHLKKKTLESCRSTYGGVWCQLYFLRV
jgi:hypothetical protein